MNNHKGIAWVIVLAILLLIGGAIFARMYWESNGAPNDWNTFSDATVTFRYPETLGTTYITPTDWPPKVQLLSEPFTCTQAGLETGVAGQTTKQVIDGHTYCVTKESEGAAGSMYTQYAYAFEKSGRVVILTFSLRFVQCGNYNEPEQSACNSERSAFDIDSIINKVAWSVQLH